MSKDTIRQIIDVSDSIRRKYKNLKRGRTETEKRLEKTFEPITHSIKKLNFENIVKTEPQTKTELQTPVKKYHKGWDEASVIPASPFTTPRTEFVNTDVIAESDKDGDDVFTPVRESLGTREGRDELGNLLGDLAAEYINFFIVADDKEKEMVYGIHRTSNGDWAIGNTVITIDHNDIYVKDKWYHGTRGLYELLFKKHPTNYTEDDKVSFIDIVLKTNAHRKGFYAYGQLNGNVTKKYREIIKPAISTTKFRKQSTQGFGLTPNNLVANNKDYNYIYWDDPNELVDRLRLLTASKNAGHTSHDNEILSIIEELREVGIIV